MEYYCDYPECGFSASRASELDEHVLAARHWDETPDEGPDLWVIPGG